MPKTVYIKSYGCQMNVYDSERMAEILRTEGYRSTPSPEGADLVILNTCHIREKAAEKVYSDIGRIRPRKNGEKISGKRPVIAVAGCVGQAEGAEIMRRAPAVELVFGPQTYQRLPELLKNVQKARRKGSRARVLDTDLPVDEKFDFLARGPKTSGPTAFLTVQEGCDKFCTFCVVPYTRGGEFSRPVAEVIREAQALVQKGALEITLLGQNVNAYHGADESGGEISLAGLIRRLSEIKGLKRIRYTTSHPGDMEDELIEVHGEVDKCMPYLHLPVQSGSDRILKAMNRRHSVKSYLGWVEKIRKARPDIALSSDFIVGFPGESEKDFNATLDLVEKVGFVQAFSFKYSPRPGTPAAEAENQVPEDVKSRRLQDLQEVLNRQQQKFNAAMVGQTHEVLFEKPGRLENQVVGKNPYLQTVHVSLGQLHRAGKGNRQKDLQDGKKENFMGRLVPVQITRAGPNSLEGKILKNTHTRTAA